MKRFLVICAVLIYLSGWLGASMAIYESCRAQRGVDGPFFDIVVGAFWPILYTEGRVYEQIAVEPRFAKCKGAVPPP